MKNSKCLLGLVLLAAIFANGCQSNSVSSSTPEAVFESFKTAAKNEDWKTFCNCMTEESVDQFAASMVMGALMMEKMGAAGSAMIPDDKKAIFDETNKKTIAVLDKYKIDRDALDSNNPAQFSDISSVTSLIKSVDNKPALVADLMKAQEGMKQLNPDAQTDFNEMFTQVKLEDVSIDGNSATGTVVSGDGEKNPTSFEKTDAGWRIVFPGPRR